MIDAGNLQTRTREALNNAQAAIVAMRDELSSIPHDDIQALPDEEQAVIYGMRHALEDTGAVISRGVRFTNEQLVQPF